MKYQRSYPLFCLTLAFLLLVGTNLTLVRSQSRRQPPTSTEKKNKRPGETPKEGEKPADAPLPPDMVPTKPQDIEKLSITTQVVNVDAVVYHKKSGQIVTGLKKPNFALFSDGAEQTITNFSTPEAPITVAMVVEYSKLGESLGYYGSGGYEPGSYEVIRPTAMFLSQFIKPPDDYVSVVAFDIRPTPLTDFTNDPTRIGQVIGLLLRNTPAFRETNLYDALKFVLVGGRGDSVVLEENKSEKSDYAGLVSVQGRRRAVILVASGIDTFSKINYGEARKVLQNAGIPVYIIGTGNLFKKKYGDNLPATDGLLGDPVKMRLAANKDRATSNSHRSERSSFYLICRQMLQLLCAHAVGLGEVAQTVHLPVLEVLTDRYRISAVDLCRRDCRNPAPTAASARAWLRRGHEAT
jgi:VWFA-related protein